MKHLLNKIHLMDCMDLMAQLDDKSIDLAIVDPPYGQKFVKKKMNRVKDGNIGPTGWHTVTPEYKYSNWDSCIPNNKYFDKLFRVSKKQIVWGGNYFGLKGGYVFWDKNVPQNFTMSGGELAWVSDQKIIKVFRYNYSGFVKGDNGNFREIRIHPTQKPVALYRWLLQNYAKEGDIILDTHSGSGSLAIACIEEKFNFIACEIDEDYHRASLKRMQPYLDQGKLW